ncbi:hypothetical protein [Staphylococcus edaphicus]|uniref:Exosortase n=1 Tax=Staphylococcus edaphicus TaxID=1955013 RepID=A0A2C6WQ66_9STAP|nr:hypothetical protein [Staphylococcus edaphicus]PHK50529.1 hypothetical protein BTJ66_03505 [Staphylococcus edaphicus]UQW81216.1 hypothetical protein MNY58_11625 [Staphylococcus edaphicus]
MIYMITFIIISSLIGIYFSKRNKPMSPSSWYKVIGVILVSLFIVSFFDNLDVIQQGFKEGNNEDVLNHILSD